MRLLLDTQAFVVLGDQTQGGIGALSKKARATLEDPANKLLLSSVSLTEIAIKSKRGKLALDKDKVSSLVQDMRLTILPYTFAHAMRLFDLPTHHNDPFDRMIIASALVEGIPLVGGDHEFKHYKELTLLW